MSESKSYFSCVLRCRKLAVGYTDKVTLPASFLASFLDTLNLDYENMPSPLILRVKQQGLSKAGASDSQAIYCGVREFSGDEGIIGIPDWLLEELQVQDEDAVVVETVKLEKGQFAQLQLVEDRETPQNMDVRAVLESHMRQRMTALFVGETICVNVGGQSMPIRFTVSALEPASAVDIVDTDLSVDIVNQQNQTQDRQTSIAELVPDKTQKITIGSSQTKQTYRLHVPAQTAAVEVVLECHLGDASLFASRLVRDAGVQDNDWSDVSAPSHTTKRLYIGSSQFSSISGTDIYVSVVGFTPECQANLV
ncbi:hypothetical protein LPJ73_002709, partial [Coemansia sp. RSA 2703]